VHPLKLKSRTLVGFRWLPLSTCIPFWNCQYFILFLFNPLLTFSPRSIILFSPSPHMVQVDKNAIQALEFLRIGKVMLERTEHIGFRKYSHCWDSISGFDWLMENGYCQVHFIVFTSAFICHWFYDYSRPVSNIGRKYNAGRRRCTQFYSKLSARRNLFCCSYNLRNCPRELY
jgi:hypothetical protein